jgi:hypothetical protein
MDDNERRLWVLNDEGLYNWYKSTRQGLYKFIKNNRDELTNIINQKLG